MASTSTTDSPPTGDANKNRDSIPKSHFQKTVSLSDWWLLKAENGPQGGGLSVSGFTCREQRAMRVFSSAPIIKSHDMFTLETIDGICVLIKGFINKARTAENGFPSDVFNHFVFGFPPYWKEYAEKCMGEHSYADCNKGGDESGYKMDAEQNCNINESLNHILPQKSDSVIRSTEDNSFVSSVAPGNLENKFDSVDHTDGDHLIADKPADCVVKKALTTSQSEGHAIISSEKDNRVLLAACHLNKSRGTKNRATPGSYTKLQMKNENCQTSAPILEGYRTRSKSVLPSGSEKVKLSSFDFETRSRNNAHSKGTGFKEPTQMSETMNKYKDCMVTETKGSMGKAMDKGTRPNDRHGAADCEKEHVVADEHSISVKEQTPKTKTRRKLAYETPGREEEGVMRGSSKSLCFSRSRSGRLLMPTLKFWSNERAIYGADGTITGIEEEIIPEHPTKGRSAEPPRKRRHLV